jgi:hypothetical protein
MVSSLEEIVLFLGSQDTLLNSVPRDRGNKNNNNRNLCLRQPQILCHLHAHFVQSAVEGYTGLICEAQDLPLMASPLTPLRKINHGETTMGAQIPDPYKQW